MKIHKDLREFIKLLNSNNVQYLVIGAYALAYYGYPRFTGDIDLFIGISPENTSKMEKIIKLFGFESTGLTAEDFSKDNQVIQLGIAPNRIDILTLLSRHRFEHG